MRRFLCAVWVLTIAGSAWAGSAPKNIIFLIGDGMGPEQVKAGGMYAHGAAGTLSFESLPYKGWVSTSNVYGAVTDSAAAATAMSTGYKVANTVISQAIPAIGGYAYGANLPTLVEVMRDQGKSTGLVTTSYMVDATPAGFGSHAAARTDYTTIGNTYFNQTRPNVIMGSTNGLPANVAENAGYTVVHNLAELQGVDANSTTHLAGEFSDWLPGEVTGLGIYPHLSQMTSKALDVLDNDPDGFFLMVEGGLIDPYCHANNLAGAVPEVVEFSNTVQTVLNWAMGRTDTLVVVTADHETGGLSVLQNNGQGVLPTVQWATTGHTGINVPVYAWGVNGRLITGTNPNTQYVQVMQAASSTLIGDVNLDGSVNALDISPFISFLTGSGAAPTEADCNGDGVVNALDISPFIQALTGGGAQVVPEPASAGVLVVTALVTLRRRRCA